MTDILLIWFTAGTIAAWISLGEGIKYYKEIYIQDVVGFIIVVSLGFFSLIAILIAKHEEISGKSFIKFK